MKSTSFISERSVEYALVGQLNGILKKRYGNVVPLFPWENEKDLICLSNFMPDSNLESYRSMLDALS